VSTLAELEARLARLDRLVEELNDKLPGNGPSAAVNAMEEERRYLRRAIQSHTKDDA
jgi:hypothetical protein